MVPKRLERCSARKGRKAARKGKKRRSKRRARKGKKATKKKSFCSYFLLCFDRNGRS